MKPDTFTENLAPAYSTTDLALVDFFGQAGASRANPLVAVNFFRKAYEQDPLAAIRLAFYFRDPRGGQGERRVFRAILREIAERNKAVADHLVRYVPNFGRWDDLLALRDTKSWIVARTYWLEAIKNGDALANKWAPREKSAQRDIAIDFINALNWSPREYRRHLAKFSTTVEQQMCAKLWREINYNHVPSQALLKYRRAFYRNDENRFSEWVTAVRTKQHPAMAATAHVTTLLPHQFIRKLDMLNYYAYGDYYGQNPDEIVFLDTLWNELLNQYGHVSHDILPVIDVSGSMFSGAQNVAPIEVSTGLGLFLSEMIQGRWNKKFITFSAKPTIVDIGTGNSLADKFKIVLRGDRGGNTDIAAVMNLLADTANLYGVNPPETILVISDMQFDPYEKAPSYTRGTYGTGFQNAVSKFATNKLRIPRFIWWNVNNTHGVNFQFHVNELYGVQTAYVSGFSPVTIKNIVETGELNPMAVIQTVLEKYSDIEVPQHLFRGEYLYIQPELPF